jgi:hypothetical protein
VELFECALVSVTGCVDHRDVAERLREVADQALFLHAGSVGSRAEARLGHVRRQPIGFAADDRRT